MTQIDIYCLTCSAKLPVSAYTRRLKKPHYKTLGCLMCGKIIINFDVDLPNYRKNLLEKVKETN